MAVTVKGLRDRGVAHDHLQSLRRPAKIFDEQRSCCMSKHVEIIAGLAAVGRESAFDLKWHPKSCVNALYGIDMAYGIRKNQIEITAVRTRNPPLTQCVHNDWRKGNVALSGFRLWRADFHPLAGSLTNVD